MSLFILIVSMVLQITGAMTMTFHRLCFGSSYGWNLLVAAFFLMFTRRLVSNHFFYDMQLDIVAETIALIISFLMICGIYNIIRQEREYLRKIAELMEMNESIRELEQKIEKNRLQ